MAHLLFFSHEWDLARHGSVDITWTDDSGSHSITEITAGIYRHPTTAANSLTHPGGGTITNTAASSWSALVQTAMDAGTAQTITCTYSHTTNRYTLAATGAVFSVTWAAGAETRMRTLLGFAGNLSGATSYTGTLAPYYSIEPRANALTGWTDVRAIADTVARHITSSADLITAGPVRVPYVAKWELDHETDAQTLSEFCTSPAYCWQDWWNEAGRYGRLCYLIDASPPLGSDIRWAFRLNNPTFDDSTHRRERPELRNRWRVTFDALIRGRF